MRLSRAAGCSSVSGSCLSAVRHIQYMFAGDCVPTWPAATGKHLSDVPSTLIRIAELHVLFCRVENIDKRLLTILVYHSSLCDCTVVAIVPISSYLWHVSLRF